MERSAARQEFLGDIFVTAIENYGYGSFTTDVYNHNADDNYDGAHAIIKFDDEDEERHVDLDTIAHGIQVMKDAELREIADGHDKGERALHNKKTGERMYLSQDIRKRVLDANRDYDLAGEIDVTDALAILEIAIFGKVVYA